MKNMMLWEGSKKEMKVFLMLSIQLDSAVVLSLGTAANASCSEGQ